ncbi:MAG: ATP-binding protein [Planctomycetota bacterium]
MLDTMNPFFVRTFVAECHAHLDSIASRLPALQAPDPVLRREAIRAILRALHSITGAAGFLDHAPLEQAGCALESLLAACRGREQRPPREVMQALRAGAAVLRALLREFSRANELAASTKPPAFPEFGRTAASPPVATSLPTMVQNLARARHKEAHLLVEDEGALLDTELFAVLLSSIVHLLRNAVEHGIEGPRQRLALGKTRQGEIRLRVLGTRGECCLIVRDDGAGMDLERLSIAAVEGGFLDPEAARDLNRGQRLELAFLSGLSAPPGPGGHRGHGIGLDAVKESVERLGGAVTLESEPGRGTTVTLAFPAASPLGETARA